MEERLDKSQFRKQTKKEAESQTKFWRSKTRDERLQAAYHLSLRAFGFDPEHPPQMDKSYFRKRKFN